METVCKLLSYLLISLSKKNVGAIGWAEDGKSWD